MKIIIKKISIKKIGSSIIALICVIIFMSNAPYKKEEPLCKGGLYMSYDDFINGKLKEVGQFVSWKYSLKGYSVKFKDKNGAIITYKRNEENYWGYQDEKCGNYMVSEKDNRGYFIYKKAKISVLAKVPVTIFDIDGNLWKGDKQIQLVRTERIYYTKDLEHFLAPGVLKIETLLEDDVELFKEYKNLKPRKRNFSSFVDRYNERNK